MARFCINGPLNDETSIYLSFDSEYSEMKRSKASLVRLGYRYVERVSNYLGENETASRIITSKIVKLRGTSEAARWNGINSAGATRPKQRRVNKSSSRTSEINIKIQLADTNCSEFNPFPVSGRTVINVPLGGNDNPKTIGKKNRCLRNSL